MLARLGRAVSRARAVPLADELRTVDRPLALEDGLRDLRTQAAGLAHVSEAVHSLLDAPDVALARLRLLPLAEERSGENY